MRKISIFDISDWFLSKEAMIPKKLQVLSYYFVAWEYALFDTSSMPNVVFQAWINGPIFPELYDKYNIGAWYDETDKQEFMDEEKFKATSIREIKDELRKYGYEINRLDEWDKESKDVVYAFQLHFNPKNATGEMDLETFAILKALNKKYPE